MATAQAPITGKPPSNLRKKLVPVSTDPRVLDSLSIIPHTLKIVGVPDSAYEVDWINALLRWKHLPPLDSVWMAYRVFPGRLNSVSNRMEYDSIMNRFAGQPFIPNYNGVAMDNRFFDFGTITYDGSFSRGLSFGNSQDAVVTSNMNLQLSGYLADSIEIMAAITDNNIPIQPDGTTQQLNEFDRIFLQFRKRHWQLSLGDIDIRQQKSYFLNFYKRLQGFSFETTTPLGGTRTNHTTVSASIAKGKFTRNVFQGQEGNQGPYRLQGANNEFFFIVLANTERVFLDGELLQRGEDQDYVINYNTAEITFTPKRMITKDKRIQVEFEYADRNYLNSNLYVANETDFGRRAKVRVGFFNNSDARNSPINQTLDAPQKNFLRQLGDSINRAFYPNAVLDTFAADKILYKKIDTVYDGGNQRDSVYMYSTNPDSARYRLSFIEVGQGKGNYVPEFNGANGKVFRWVAPVGGVPQGRFEPAQFLVTPKQQQVLTVGVEVNLTSRTQLITEGALSRYDLNLFSSRGNTDNTGFATKWQIRHTQPLPRSKRKASWVTDAGLEWVAASFKPLERLRNVEFTRDWGLPLQAELTGDEKILTAGTEIADPQRNQLRYQVTRYQRGNQFTGWRNSLVQVHEVQNWKFNNAVMLTRVYTNFDQGYFFRPTLQLSRKLARLRNYMVSAAYSLEHNAIRKKATDSLAAQSFAFETFQLAWQSDPAKPNKWGITWFTRNDAYPLGKELVKADRSRNINLNAELLKSEKHQFRFNTTYRSLEVLQPGITGLKADHSLLGRAEYLINEWKGLVVGSILYETGAGQEQKRDIAFLEVPAGQGAYTWNDYNGDGIQQLNEFEIALFQDQARYIRIFTPTNEFIKANYNTFNYSFSINPRAGMDQQKIKGFRKFLSRVNLQSSLQVNKKLSSNGSLSFNPFGNAIRDTNLITLSSVWANTFSFNRFSTKWGFDLNNARSLNKALLTYGYESRVLQDWTLRFRWNISRSVLAEWVGRQGTNQLISSNPKFGNRNFQIRQASWEPKISYTRGSNFRTSIGYRMGGKQNRMGDEETARSNALNAEVKYNLLQQTSIQGKFTYNEIRFQSKGGLPNANSPAAYIMLDGLLPGKNFLWTLDLSRRLSKSLELNIQYEGRRPGSGRVVHVGRASVRALL